MPIFLYVWVMSTIVSSSSGEIWSQVVTMQCWGWDAASSISAAASSGAAQLRCTSYHISRPSPVAWSPTSSQQFTVTAIRHVNFLTDFNQRKEIPFAQKQQRLRRTVTKPLTLTSRAVNGTLRSFTVPTKSSSLLKAPASSFTIKNAKETFKHCK